MPNRVSNNLKNNPAWHHRTHLQNLELEWAHVFHDSIRGRSWLENLPLNIGRWAGNYSFFYVLCRLLADFQPKSIVEFGLGESSKVVSAFLDNELIDSKHLVVEENADWQQAFQERFSLSDRSEVWVFPAVEKTTENGVCFNGYEGLEPKLELQKFDLYVVDGPKGSQHSSRFDIVSLAESLDADDQFIIVLDDHDRLGEQETAKELIKKLAAKDIAVHVGEYVGKSSQIVIATEQYRFATTM